MPCFRPLTAWRGREYNQYGNRPMVFNPNQALNRYNPEKLPCGQCIGCRLERSRQWAMRCYHEASLYNNNSFITLTFSPEHLEKRDNPWSLDVTEFQKFMKRLRKKFSGIDAVTKDDGTLHYPIRFFHCGEYGDKNARPHYHACLFNFDFPDKELWKTTKSGHRLYVSEELEKLWPYGFSTIGDVTFESAAYVARYIVKKVNGKMREDDIPVYDDDGNLITEMKHYEWLDPETGEIRARKPEYTTMSRRPGIGREWLKLYMDDVFPEDEVVVNGVRMRPPKYYDGILESERPYEFDSIKENRKKKAKKHIDNNCKERLNVREQIALKRLKDLPRNVD